MLLIAGGYCGDLTACPAEVISFNNDSRKCHGVQNYSSEFDAATHDLVEGIFLSCGGYSFIAEEGLEYLAI